MKIDKEYPATHSMATAWYCVDEDGNVGVFDIEDNGPVPRKGAREEFIDDLLFDKFVKGDRSKIREIPLTKEQIKCLLHYKHKSKEQWRNNHGQWVNYDWVGLIVRIDMKKYYVLEEAFSLITSEWDSVICLSQEDGWFFLKMAYNRNGILLP